MLSDIGLLVVFIEHHYACWWMVNGLAFIYRFFSLMTTQATLQYLLHSPIHSHTDGRAWHERCTSAEPHIIWGSVSCSRTLWYAAQLSPRKPGFKKPTSQSLDDPLYPLSYSRPLLMSKEQTLSFITRVKTSILNCFPKPNKVLLLLLEHYD